MEIPCVVPPLAVAQDSTKETAAGFALSPDHRAHSDKKAVDSAMRVIEVTGSVVLAC
jgi:hypothetical protein